MEKEFLHGLVKFRRKPAKTGPEYIFVIPRNFIKNGLIAPEKKYEIYLKELPDEIEDEDESVKDP